MKRTLRKYPRLLLSGTAVLCLLTLFIAQSISVLGDDPGDEAPDSDLIAVGPTLDRETLRRNVYRGNLLEQRMIREEQDSLNGVYGPAPAKDPNALPPAPMPTLPPKTGILTVYNLPSGWSMWFDTESVWQNFVGGQFYKAFAGAKLDSPYRALADLPEQGAVVVQTIPANPNANGTSREALTPYRCGPVRIAAQVGENELLLVSTTLPAWFMFVVSDAQYVAHGVYVNEEYVRVSGSPCSATDR